MPTTKQTALITLTIVTLALALSSPLAKAYINILTFTSCDAAGNQKLTFALGENVYVMGGWFSPNRTVSIYVIPDLKNPAPSNATAPPVNATTDASGHVPITRIWTADKIGKYDVWVDTNQNGIYDKTGDRYYYSLYCYLFNVIPEYLVGSIGAVAAMIGSLALYRVKNARRNRKPT